VISPLVARGVGFGGVHYLPTLGLSPSAAGVSPRLLTLPWGAAAGAVRTDWVLFRGDALRLSFPLLGDPGAGFAGYNFALTFRPRLGGADALLGDGTRSRALTVADAAAGLLTGVLTHADTDGLRPGAYRWWAKCVDAGRRFVAGWGEVTVRDTDW
jgi:hypothetical protein